MQVEPILKSRNLLSHKEWKISSPKKGDCCDEGAAGHAMAWNTQSRWLPARELRFGKSPEYWRELNSYRYILRWISQHVPAATEKTL